MGWIHLLNMFTFQHLWQYFWSMEHQAHGFLVCRFVARTTTIFFPPNFRGCLGALSPGVPLISVHGSLTMPGMWGRSFIICRWLVTIYIGAFSHFPSSVSESCMTWNILDFDGVYDALAFDAKALSLIPHFLQYFGSNPCSMFFKSSEFIIRKIIWNRRIIFYLWIAMLQLFQCLILGLQLA